MLEHDGYGRAISFALHLRFLVLECDKLVDKSMNHIRV